MAEDVNTWWIENSTMILKTAEELLGKTSGRGPPNEKESWWWSLNTQDKIKRKKEARRAYDRNESEENRLGWKNVNKEVKKKGSSKGKGHCNG